MKIHELLLKESYEFSRTVTEVKDITYDLSALSDEELSKLFKKLCDEREKFHSVIRKINGPFVPELNKEFNGWLDMFRTKLNLLKLKRISDGLTNRV